jgi:hypothetical protein
MPNRQININFWIRKGPKFNLKKAEEFEKQGKFKKNLGRIKNPSHLASRLRRCGRAKDLKRETNI